MYKSLGSQKSMGFSKFSYTGCVSWMCINIKRLWSAHHCPLLCRPVLSGLIAWQCSGIVEWAPLDFHESCITRSPQMALVDIAPLMILKCATINGPILWGCVTTTFDMFVMCNPKLKWFFVRREIEQQDFFRWEVISLIRVHLKSIHLSPKIRFI